MASYINYQSILNAALGEYQAKGFRLIEKADHFVDLYYCDERVRSFSQTGATITTIHQACLEYLEKGKELWA